MWTPEAFQNATLRELHEGITMWRRVNGMDDDPDRVDPNRMTRDELDELKQRYPDTVH